MSKMSEKRNVDKWLDYTIEHSLIHCDMMVSPSPNTVTLALVIRGKCHVIRSGVAREVAERAIYVREAADEAVEYYTNYTGVFEQLAVHLNTKALFATTMRVDNLVEQRFEHAMLSALSSTISVDDIASMCCMSLSTFKRHFNTRYDISPHRWIQDVRLTLAYEILSTSDVSAEYAARLCGFNSSSYFISMFKTRYGITPSCVRQIARLKSNE